MVNFDAPDRAACTVKRPRTNTPLQALTLLNDPAYLEMALGLAEGVLTGEADPDKRLSRAYQLVLCREPNAEEMTMLGELLRERLAHFQSDPKAARALLDNPAYHYAPQHPDQAELAAWFHLCTILLNLDETVTKP